MTEDEAKTKWCPFSRQAVVVSRDLGTAATTNRDGGEHYGAENCLCIGSACMAWRWTGAVAPKSNLTRQVDLAIAVLGTDEQRAELRASSASHRLGFCGLAGGPQ